MARRKTRITNSTAFIRRDLASWNFVIFLTLAFMLLVVILVSMKGVALDLRTRAGLACPNPLAAFGGKLPAAGDCIGEWKISTDARGCQVFLCQGN
jgi:hypothetical protein